MAVVNSLSTPFLVTKSSSTSRRAIRLPGQRLLVFASSHDNILINTSTTTTTIITNTHQIGSTSKITLNKVFEDKSTGIVCYRDENGEITCEGYDEGPRLCHDQLLNTPSKSRDEEIVELLQRNWVHISDVAAE